jgi:hypothetical protein
VTGELRPATERLLERLPGKRLLYVALWALVPWLNAGANLLLDTGARSAIWEQSRTLVVLNYAALSLAIVVALWGAARVARRLELLRATTPDLFAHAPADLFRAIGDRVGPVAAAGATAIALGLAVAGEGAAATLLRGTTWFLVGVPLWTYVWTYASLQLGLFRLGRTSCQTCTGSSRPSGFARSARSRSWRSGCCSPRWCRSSSPDYPTSSVSRSGCSSSSARSRRSSSR